MGGRNRDVKGRRGLERRKTDVWQTGRHISIQAAEHGFGLCALVSWVLIVADGMRRRGWGAMAGRGPGRALERQHPQRPSWSSWPRWETGPRGGGTVSWVRRRRYGTLPKPSTPVSQPSNWPIPLVGRRDQDSDNWSAMALAAQGQAKVFYLQGMGRSIASWPEEDLWASLGEGSMERGPSKRRFEPCLRRPGCFSATGFSKQTRRFHPLWAASSCSQSIISPEAPHGRPGCANNRRATCCCMHARRHNPTIAADSEGIISPGIEGRLSKCAVERVCSFPLFPGCVVTAECQAAVRRPPLELRLTGLRKQHVWFW